MALTDRKPKIFNIDQGNQFTGQDWVGELQKNEIRISMEGKSRWIDNVFIEWLWRSLRYEETESVNIIILNSYVLVCFFGGNGSSPHPPHG